MEKDQLDLLLQTCEEEKLHLSGMIQPHGGLIVIDKDSYLITHISQNLDQFIDKKNDTVLGNDFKELFPTWVEYLEQVKDPTLKPPYTYIKLKSEKLYIKISKTETSYAIDIERIPLDKDFTSLKKNQHKLYITPDSEESYKHYVEIFMGIISKTLKFDRIMLYQFQDDWSGKVVAEHIASDDIGSYLNLRFPASDIPKIARDLYTINPSRAIVDIDANNVDILGYENNTVPDLTYSEIRSVSPVHIQYLRNMGVKSSFSIPLLISNKLWGLLACHNFTELYINPSVKVIAQEQTKIFANGLQHYGAKTRMLYLDSIEYKIKDLVDSIIYGKAEIEMELENKKYELMELIPSDGFVLVVDKKIVSCGSLPDQESFMQIDKQFINETKVGVLNSESIQNTILFQSDYLGPSGVLGVKLEFTKSVVIRAYWFRSEFLTELEWAGNPNKPVIEDSGALKLSPRRSFETYIEVITGHSKKFDNLQISTALKLANVLFKQLQRLQ